MLKERIKRENPKYMESEAVENNAKCMSYWKKGEGTKRKYRRQLIMDKYITVELEKKVRTKMKKGRGSRKK